MKWSLGVGAATTIVLLLLDRFLKPALPEALEASDRTEPNWLSSLAAMLYGGITEEILMRWSLMSLLVWIAWKVLKHANAVLFLSSEMASFVTGETLMVDGGAVAQ